MEDPALYWTKVAAIGQVAGAIATALAAVVSLWIAFHGRKPRLKLTVGERIIFGGGQSEIRVLMFKIANAGERPVHISGVGWLTGWSKWGPSFLQFKPAIQITGGAFYGDQAPPFEIQPGAAVTTQALMENVLAYAAERAEEPLFTRDWPFIGRRATRVQTQSAS